MAQSTPQSGRSHGWSNSLGCCMPMPYTVPEISKPTLTDPDVVLHFDQPTVHAPLTYLVDNREPAPVPRPVKAATWFESHAGQMRSRASSLSFHSLMWPSQSRRRPQISAPMDFRHVSGTRVDPPRVTRHRRLELSIYLPSNRLSDLPDFESSDWEQKLEEIRRPAPALLRSHTDGDLERPHHVPRKPISMPPVLRQSAYGELGLAQLSLENGPGPIVTDAELDEQTVPTHAKDLASYLGTPVPIPNRADSCKLREAPPVHARSESNSSFRTFISSPKSGRSWSQNDFTRHIRSTSSRQAKPDPVDIAITELNNIVKERRLLVMNKSQSTDRRISSGPLSPTHIPAIAPSMKLKARSETLSDIGSAFSVPLSAKAMPLSPRSPASQYTPSLLSPRSPREQGPSMRASTKSRLANWLGVTSTQLSPALEQTHQSHGLYSLEPSQMAGIVPSHTQRPSTSTIQSDTISTISTPSERSFGNVNENMTPATSVFSPASTISSSPFAQQKAEYAPSRPSLSTLVSSPRSSNSLKHKAQISTRTVSNEVDDKILEHGVSVASPPPYSPIERGVPEHIAGPHVVGIAF